MNYEFREGYSSEWIGALLELHNKTDMKRPEAMKKVVDRSFAQSYAVITCWLGNTMVACGRMISDGGMYSSIFDVVVDPEHQKKGLGRQVVERLVKSAPHTCIHLTSTLGNEPFYSKLDFKMHKTAMALYPESFHPSPYLQYEV